MRIMRYVKLKWLPNSALMCNCVTCIAVNYKFWLSQYSILRLFHTNNFRIIFFSLSIFGPSIIIRAMSYIIYCIPLNSTVIFRVLKLFHVFDFPCSFLFILFSFYSLLVPIIMPCAIAGNLARTSIRRGCILPVPCSCMQRALSSLLAGYAESLIIIIISSSRLKTFATASVLHFHFNFCPYNLYSASVLRVALYFGEI
jgi:hypothetical protein